MSSERPKPGKKRAGYGNDTPEEKTFQTTFEYTKIT